MATTYSFLDMKAHVRDLLEHLGEDAHDVADHLAANDVKGIRNTVRQLNPIVRYVWREIGECKAIRLMPGGILRITLPTDEQLSAILPQPVRDFLVTFNAGAFPNLELPLELI